MAIVETAKNKRIFLSVTLFFISFIYMALLTYDLPFWWCDFLDLHLATQKPFLYKYLGVGQEFSFRPLVVLYYFILYKIFGANPIVFHLGKAFLFSLTSVMNFLVVSIFNINLIYAFLSSVFFMVSMPVLASVAYTYDFQITVDLLFLSCFYCFLKIYFEDAQNISLQKRISLYAGMLFFGILANYLKENAKVLPIIITFFILFTDWRKIFKYLPFIFIISIFGLNPGFFVGLAMQGKNDYLGIVRFYFRGFHYIPQGLSYLIRNIITFPLFIWILVLVVLLYGVMIKFKRRLPITVVAKPSAKYGIIFYVSWLLVFIALFVCWTASMERNYAMFIIPLWSLVFLVLSIRASLVREKAYKVFFTSITVIVLISTFAINSFSSARYLYGWGNMFRAINDVKEYTERNDEDAIIFTNNITGGGGSGSIGDMGLIKAKNIYLNLSRGNSEEIDDIISKISKGSNPKKVLLVSYTWHQPIDDIKEKKLLKTFMRGPHCIKLYIYDKKFKEKRQITYAYDTKYNLDGIDTVYRFKMANPLENYVLKIKGNRDLGSIMKIYVKSENGDYSFIEDYPMGIDRECEFDITPLVKGHSECYIKVKLKNNVFIRKSYQIFGREYKSKIKRIVISGFSV